MVTAADGKETTLETKNIVIATGSDVARLPGVEIDEKTHRLLDRRADASPSRRQMLIVVGAGVIGLELGSVWRRLGAEVTVVEFLDRILPGMDGEVAKQFQRMLEKQGFKFRLGHKVDQGRHDGRGRQGDDRAGQGRRGARRSRPMSCWSRSAASIHRRPWPRGGRASTTERGQVVSR